MQYAKIGHDLLVREWRLAWLYRPIVILVGDDRRYRVVQPPQNLAVAQGLRHRDVGTVELLGSLGMLQHHGRRPLVDEQFAQLVEVELHWNFSARSALLHRP